MNTIAGILALLGFVVLFTSTIGGGKRDGRFKTGHRGNVLPEDVPLNLRLTVACVLWGVAVCMVWPMHVLQVAVAGAATVGTWLAYPAFYSRYKRSTTSPAKFLFGRLTSCVMLGILMPLYIFQLALPSGQALLPTFSGEPAERLASSTQSAPAPTTEPAATSVESTPIASAQAQQASQESTLQEAATPTAVATMAPTAPANSSEASRTLPESAQTSLPANPVTTLIQAALAANWQEVDRLVASTKEAHPPAERGDRKAARAVNAQGLASLGLRQYEASITAFTEGVRADPSDVEILNNLGFAYVTFDRSNDALSTLARVLLVAPERSSAWANLSEAFSQLRNENAAIGALRLAVRFSGNREKTTEYLRRTIASHPHPVYRSIAARVLQEVGSIPGNAETRSDPTTSESQGGRT